MSNPRSGIQWLIKTQGGKQIGPYGTDAVLRLISEGAFAGLEEIKRYPDGKWNPISKQADFYDKLLEALEEVNKAPKNSKNKKPAEFVFDKVEKIDEPAKLEKYENETVIVRPPEEKTEILPEILKLTWLEDDYSIRKDVTPENFKDLKTIEKCTNSIPPRAGSELFINFLSK